MKLSNKTKFKLQSHYGGWALITGATSGIGKEIALGLAKSGINLVLNARRKSELMTIATDWETQYGIEVRTIALDLSTPEQAYTLFELTEEIDIGLFVAAAGFGTSGNFIENNIEDELNMIDVNCKSVVLLTHQFAQRFKHREHSGIILFSSLVAFQGTPRAANYAATKSFIQTFAEGITVELSSYNIDILAVAPGPVSTGFGNRADMKMDGAEKADLIAKDILNALGNSSKVVPGRLGKFLTYSLRLLPRWGRVQVMKQVMGGMTKHQD